MQRAGQTLPCQAPSRPSCLPTRPSLNRRCNTRSLQLCRADVPLANIHRDVGVSNCSYLYGTSATWSGTHELNIDGECPLRVRIFNEPFNSFRSNQEHWLPVQRRNSATYQDLVAEIDPLDQVTLFIGHKEAFDLSEERFVPQG